MTPLHLPVAILLSTPSVTQASDTTGKVLRRWQHWHSDKPRTGQKFVTIGGRTYVATWITP